jgi:hypothetical protein
MSIRPTFGFGAVGIIRDDPRASYRYGRGVVALLSEMHHVKDTGSSWCTRAFIAIKASDHRDDPRRSSS